MSQDRVRPASSWLRRRRLKLALALAGLGLFGGWSYVRIFVYSIYFLDGFSRIEQGGRLAPLLAYPVERTSERIALPSGEPLRVDVYRPAAAGRWPALLIVPGFTRQGLEDPRMIGLARLVSGAGALVCMPSLEGIFHYRWDAGLVPQIEEAFLYMAGRPDALPGRLGIFGISISGGFALAIAERPKIASRLDFAIAFAPFFDYRNLLEFSLTRPSNPFSRWIALYNVLPAFLPAGSPDLAALEETLRLKILELPEQAQAAAGRLSPAGLELLRVLESGSAEELQPRLRQALDFSDQLGHSLSPHENLCSLHGSLFILHGADDDVIPFSESLLLARACQACPNLRCDLLVTGLYNHANLEAGRKGFLHAIGVEAPELFHYCMFLGRVVARLLP